MGLWTRLFDGAAGRRQAELDAAAEQAADRLDDLDRHRADDLAAAASAGRRAATANAATVREWEERPERTAAQERLQRLQEARRAVAEGHVQTTAAAARGDLDGAFRAAEEERRRQERERERQQPAEAEKPVSGPSPAPAYHPRF